MSVNIKGMKSEFDSESVYNRDVGKEIECAHAPLLVDLLSIRFWLGTPTLS